MGDHPRSRGVYGHPIGRGDVGQGSSPLARGLLRLVLNARQPGRIIPARAGFTHAGRAARWTGADHPRSRGVYLTSPDSHPCRAGSSPLARGLPPVPGHAGQRRRIIPARAGFTHVPACTSATVRDHPRSRGVYPRAAGSSAASTGSSPLARGLHTTVRYCFVTFGIIPARAGFTSRRRWAAGGRPDHPRSRGVYPTCSDLSTS